MKKVLLLLLPVWMLLSLPVQAFAAKSEFDAAVLLNDVGAVIRVYELGDKVTVESQQGDYYVLSDGTLVEKWLLRLDSEELPEGTTVRALADAEKEAAEKAAKEAEEKAAREAAGETVEETAEETAEEVPAETPVGRTVYARNREETPLYDNVYCEGEPLRMLEYNQELVVEDEFGKVMRVMLEEEVPVPEPEEGAEPTENPEPAASPEPAESAETEETEPQEPEKIQIVGYVLAADTKKAKYGGGGDDGGGGGGGGGADGGEISLTNYRVMPKQEGFVLLANVTPDATEGEEETEPFVGGPGMILGKGAEGYACLFNRGDIVKVTEKPDKRSAPCTILLEDGRKATIRRSLLYFKSDRFYQAWTGYTKNGALLYQKWRTQLDDPKKLAVNTELQVIGRFEDFNIVQLEDETIGLVSAELLSLTKVAYGGGGDGGGGGGGGEWTAPVM